MSKTEWENDPFDFPNLLERILLPPKSNISLGSPLRQMKNEIFELIEAEEKHYKIIDDQFNIQKVFMGGIDKSIIVVSGVRLIDEAKRQLPISPDYTYFTNLAFLQTPEAIIVFKDIFLEIILDASQGKYEKFANVFDAFLTHDFSKLPDSIKIDEDGTCTCTDGTLDDLLYDYHELQIFIRAIIDLADAFKANIIEYEYPYRKSSKFRLRTPILGTSVFRVMKTLTTYDETIVHNGDCSKIFALLIMKMIYFESDFYYSRKGDHAEIAPRRVKNIANKLMALNAGFTVVSMIDENGDDEASYLSKLVAVTKKYREIEKEFNKETEEE